MLLPARARFRSAVLSVAQCVIGFWPNEKCGMPNATVDFTFYLRRHAPLQGRKEEIAQLNTGKLHFYRAAWNAVAV